MTISDILKGLDFTVLSGSCEGDIVRLVMDSREVGAGDAFVCITGAVSDGHSFFDQVVQKGAALIVVEKDTDICRAADRDICVVKTDSTRYALAVMAANFYGRPAERLKTIGVTGTKGKTTTTYMIREVLEGAGIRTGLIGTIETIIGDERIPAENTTPESLLVQQYFARMVEAGCEAVVMEVSSQGLMLDRVAGFKFDIGVYTNLSPDHIGPNEHKDFEDYALCKAKLFKNCSLGIFNADDEHAGYMMDNSTCDRLTFGISKGDYMASDVKLFTRPGILGVEYELSGAAQGHVSVDIPGGFSVYNSLAAIAVCHTFTDDTDSILNAISKVRVRGRAEIIPVKDAYTLMIDYAHNAMSLESLLNSLKAYEHGRLVTLFGCGGNRDRNRRFEMGEVSSRLSDLTIVTSDNPRNEEPMAIIEDIITGVMKADGEYVTIPDRREAIKYAIEHGREGDIIVLAGKGHEDYQIIKGTKYHMDERELIADIKKELGL